MRASVAAEEGLAVNLS